MEYNPQGRIDQICRKMGIEIIKSDQRPNAPMQTRARATMWAIYNEHGEAHLVLTLRCIVDSGNEANKWELDKYTLGAVSDVLYAHAEDAKKGLAFLDKFAQIDLAKIRKDQKDKFHLNRRDRIAAVITVRLQEMEGEKNV